MKSNDGGRKGGGKKSGRSFGGRRDDYVNTFRWGFVEGSEREDAIDDDELYFGEPGDEKPKEPAKRSRNKRSEKPPRKTEVVEKVESEKTERRAPKEDEKSRGDRSKRKKPAKAAPMLPLFEDDEDDDNDLNLPSYGRTPIPTDEEIRRIVAKKATAAKETNREEPADRNKRAKREERHDRPLRENRDAEPSRKKRDEIPSDKAPGNRSAKRHEPASAEKPVGPERGEERDERSGAARGRREQMVWDPDRREYVPLVVPELRTPKPRQNSPKGRAMKADKTPPVTESTKPAETVPSKPVSAEAESPRRDGDSSRRNRRSQDSKKSTVRESAESPSFAEEAPAAKPTERQSEKAASRREDAKRDKQPGRTARDAKPESRPAPRPAPPVAPLAEAPKRAAKPDARKAAPEKREIAAENKTPKPSEEKSSRKKAASHRERASSRPLPPQRGDLAPLVESSAPDPSDVESEATGFAKLGVSEAMLDALRMVRYLEPTPIQAGVFQQVKAGVDVMGQAQTGTGKTAAFSIPIIEGVEDCPPGNDPVALILVPTRELAVQVRDEAARLCYGRDIRVAACYGGKPIAKQISRLREGVDIIVGTPGRILDLMNRHALSLDALRWVVLDEADRMLDIGFRPDIEKILRRTPKERQTLLFSATLPQPVVRLAEKYMNAPEILDFSNKGVAVDTIDQYYVTVDPERKFDALVYLMNEQQPNQAIIFTRTKRGADRLARLLSKRFESLAAIHGDLSQSERDRVMTKFRAGKLRYLVATDVVGRGIDVSGISHIINFDIPAFCDDYVHRVGRTGRMGREGVAYTFVTVQEGSELTRIEMRIDKLLQRADLKGFESFTKPSDPNASPDDTDPTQSSEPPKPVFGKPVRKIRRAL